MTIVKYDYCWKPPYYMTSKMEENIFVGDNIIINKQKETKIVMREETSGGGSLKTATGFDELAGGGRGRGYIRRHADERPKNVSF